MCVYDDLEGWNTLPFLGSGEFYCEYGNFDYTVSVPAGMIVAGSGELQNPEEVLTKKEQTRLAVAKNSDKTVMIREAEDIGSEAGVGAGSLRTWHFKMNNTPSDVYAFRNIPSTVLVGCGQRECGEAGRSGGDVGKIGGYVGQILSHVGLSGRKRRGQRLGACHGVPESVDGRILALVRISVPGSHQ